MVVSSERIPWLHNLDRSTLKKPYSVLLLFAGCKHRSSFKAKDLTEVRGKETAITLYMIGWQRSLFKCNVAYDLFLCECSLWIVSEHTLACVLLLRQGIFH